MYGLHFKSMYSGSMVGKGIEAFAVMGYFIACAWENRGLVDCNPVILAAIFGCDVEDVNRGLAVLTAPDPDSRNEEEEGRRLVRLGNSFTYRVVSWEKYQAWKNPAMRREYERRKKQEQRERAREESASPTTPTLELTPPSAKKKPPRPKVPHPSERPDGRLQAYHDAWLTHVGTPPSWSRLNQGLTPILAVLDQQHREGHPEEPGIQQAPAPERLVAAIRSFGKHLTDLSEKGRPFQGDPFTAFVKGWTAYDGGRRIRTYDESGRIRA
jgi:hypothetical protein